MMKPVIQSLLETDLYKFTMWQALFHRSANVQAEYTFVCRNQPAVPLAHLAGEMNAQLDHLCSLSFTASDLDYLRTLRFLTSDFIDFLAVFRFQRRFIEITGEGETLKIVARGPQVHVMGFEIFVLSLIGDLDNAKYGDFNRLKLADVWAEGDRRLDAKIELLRRVGPAEAGQYPFEFFDFGIRRRFSRAWHEHVVERLTTEAGEWFKGTSNVEFARRFGLVPIGTMAHEYLQTFQALNYRLRDFQKEALESWVHEFRGDLGIALTDVVGMDAFLADFDLYFAKLFDGLRHDSGDPYVWGEKALAHYDKLRIDPRTKRLVFSDGLTLQKAIALHAHFSKRIKVGFGIGTHLSNDLGPTPLNVVMKLTRCNGQPVAKLSDSPGKTLCTDEAFLAYLRQVFNIKSEPIASAEAGKEIALA